LSYILPQTLSVYFIRILLAGSKRIFYFCKSDVLAVQGHSRSWFWCQSKARLWLPISPS